MFIGEYAHSVDAKGRMIMPAKFRQNELGEVFYVTKGTEDCLFVYSKEEWEKFSENLASLPITTNPQAAAFVRFFLSGAAECELDKLGRINIPAHLREHAGITKDVKVLGVRSRVEIWDAGKWEEYKDKNITLENVTMNMGSIGMDF